MNASSPISYLGTTLHQVAFVVKHIAAAEKFFNEKMGVSRFYPLYDFTDHVTDKTFRGTLREAQGVFAIHEHGGVRRPSHPHVHALLSPRFQNRMAVHISPARIQRVKERWEREVLVGLQRQERRVQRMRQLVPVLLGPARERDDRVPLQVLPRLRAARRTSQLELFDRAERSVRLVRASGWTSRWLRFRRRGSLWARDPEKAARRATFRIASKAIPRTIREVLRLLRGVRTVAVRQR